MTDISTSTTLAQLVARSQKLGADRAICNWGGGNTSAKADEIDFRGRPVRILWVKGSGSDLATCTEASFTGLFLDDVLPLLERERMSDTEMVNYLAHCFSEPGRPRPSIETLLHGFLPFTHIDHTHADATNYFACAANGEELARDCFGDDLIWIPYRRPGFGLAREVALAVHGKPGAKLVILAKHGLITWGASDEDCFAATLAKITRARDYVEARIARAGRRVFGGPRVTTLAVEVRSNIAAHVAPVLRGLISAEKSQILRFEDGEDVLDFAGSQDAPRLTKIGAACPDHLVHTKPWPLLVEWMPGQSVEALVDALRSGVSTYVVQYRHYLEENALQNLDPDASTPVYRAADASADPHPRVILIPGVGMFTTGKDAMMADVAAQLYHRAVAVMHGTEACGGFISLSNAESYAVEYWPLEQYKLRLAPPER
ncbi:MAG: class II aldolase/adducin family protein, partial [Ktedonobacteraceae bacterium]